MKKLLIAVLVLALAGAGVYWFFFYSDRNYPEAILPENTAVYLYFPGTDQVRKEGSQTLLWKRIAASPRKELYRYQLESLIRFTESVVGVDPRPLLNAIQARSRAGCRAGHSGNAIGIVDRLRGSGEANERVFGNETRSQPEKAFSGFEKSAGCLSGWMSTTNIVAQPSNRVFPPVMPLSITI